MGEWSNLTAQQKAAVIIKFALYNGVSDIKTIRDTYNNMYIGDAHVHEGTTSDSKLRIPTKEEYIADKIDSVRVYALESARKTPSEQSIRFYRYDPEAAKQHRDINNPDNFMTGTMFNALVDKYLGDIDRAKQEYHSYLYNNNPGYAASYDKYQEALKRGDYIEQANCIANLSRFYPKGLPNGNQTFAANPSKWGFTKIDTWDVMPGDLVQHLDQNGVPGHAMMYNGIDKKGVPSFNYASGSGPNSWGVGKHYPDAVSSDKKHLWDVDVYRYTGTPQDSIQWINEWAQKYIQNNEFAEGGKIHIKPSKRGTFTAAATKHGKSVQAFARQVLANKENYSPAMVKKANFARNAAGWKHSTGGPLYPFSFQKNPYWKTPVVRYAEGGSVNKESEFLPNENIQNVEVWLNKGTRFQKKRPGTVNLQNIVEALNSNGPDNQYVWDNAEHTSYSAFRRNPDYRAPLVQSISSNIQPIQTTQLTLPQINVSVPKPSFTKVVNNDRWLPIDSMWNPAYGYETFHLENSPYYGIKYYSIPGAANAGQGSSAVLDSTVMGIPIQELNERIFDYRNNNGGWNSFSSPN